MAALFADVPAALANSVEIARRCNLTLELGRPRLPDYPTPPGVTLEQHCRDLAQQGLEARLAELYPDPAARAAQRPQYAARLDAELATIEKMGFAGYFLIVADFINWAKGNGIPVGPGRGSGAGSLVAYALGITDLDPLRYDLLFERFLNPERVSMPDFDIDFCQDQRIRVIEYVKHKYGAHAVSQIATFGTLGAKAVVRDVGRVLDMPYSKCDQLSKLIPHNPADPWTLERALREEPAFAEAVAGDEEVAQLIELARPLEGLTRNVGMHAGGVLIAPGKLTDFCPLYCAQGTDAVISQFDKDDIEAIGLVKFDFLGLTTLTILDKALAHVRRLDPAAQDLTLEAIPLDDPKTYEIFKTGNTAAVFQFESPGMRNLLKGAKPDRLEDLIALNALHRPGPRDLIPEFTDRKHGRHRIEYLDPRLAPILGETYGIMVYQEQVMRIAQAIGGYSLGGADQLRRAMGKKKPEEMAEHRSIFVAGAVRNGVAEDVASTLFDLMEKFAGYGFNKSHSAAYAVIACRTAYLKAHYPAAFYAANLSAVMSDTDEVRALIDDARANGITVLAPDINQGQWEFEPIDAKTVRYGLGGVKGTGRSAIDAIVAARDAGGPFTSLFDLCARVDKQRVNRRVVEALVRAGAFDALDGDRAKLIANVGRALEQAERAAASRGQASLFGGAAQEPAAALHYVTVRPWSERERLANEKLALGFYFSGHLFRAYEAEARRLAPTRLADLRPTRDPVRLAGVVVASRSQNTRRGRNGVILLDDATAQVEVIVAADLYDRSRAVLKEDQLVFVNGRVRFDEANQQLRIYADDVFDLPQARSRARVALRIEVEADRGGAATATQLATVLAPYRVGNGDAAGGCRVVVSYSNGVGCAEIPFSEDWRVRPDEALLAELKTRLRVREACFSYANPNTAY
jgi:DNA polymerase-3 subunit alpha